MTTPHPAPDPVVVAPDGGDTVFLVGDTYTTILSGAQTGGAFTLLEAIVPPDTGPPPHVHHAEDELFLLLEGELTFRVAGESHDATAGTTIYVPKETPHSFTNGAGGAAKMLFMYTPAGMDGMFAEIGHPGVRGQVGPPRDMADVVAMVNVAAKYRFSVVEA